MNMARVMDRAAPYAAQLRTTGEEPVWLKSLRERAMERFQAEGFPTLRTEAWKYTNLDRLARNVFVPYDDVTRIDEEVIAPYRIDGHLLWARCRKAFASLRSAASSSFRRKSSSRI
jgi:hypothetical protein